MKGDELPQNLIEKKPQERWTGKSTLYMGKDSKEKNPTPESLNFKKKG